MLEVKIDTSGLDELQRRVEQLSEPHPVSFSELFPDAFMMEHTDFGTIQEMLDESKLLDDVGDEVEPDAVRAIFDGDEWNTFVAQRTKFPSWEEMKAQAGNRYFSSKLLE